MPPHRQFNLHISVNAGILPIFTFGEPGTQDDTIFGTHGIGVNTPIAAAVAEATCGFAILLHTPNGNIFTIGLLSIMVAVGNFIVLTGVAGKICSADGATPKEHLHSAS